MTTLLSQLRGEIATQPTSDNPIPLQTFGDLCQTYHDVCQSTIIDPVYEELMQNPHGDELLAHDLTFRCLQLRDQMSKSGYAFDESVESTITAVADHMAKRYIDSIGIGHGMSVGPSEEGNDSAGIDSQAAVLGLALCESSIYDGTPDIRGNADRDL